MGCPLCARPRTCTPLSEEGWEWGPDRQLLPKLRCSRAMGLGCEPCLMAYSLWAPTGGGPSEGSSPYSGAVLRFRGWLVRRLCYFLWSLEQHIPPCWDASQKVMESTR